MATHEASSAWLDLLETPFSSGFVDADGVPTRYLRAGRRGAPSVVLLHGLGGSLEAYTRNIPALAQHWDVIAIDMLGCGFTGKPDRPYQIADYAAHVRAALAALGVSRAAFVAVSLGAWISGRIAIDTPELVQALVLTCPSGLFSLTQTQTGHVGPRTSAVEDPSWERVRGIIEGMFYDPAEVTDDIIAVRQRIYRLPEMSYALAHQFALMDPVARERNNLTESEWASIQAPTLIMRHIDHPDVYLDTADALAGLIEGAVTHELPRTAHWPQFEASEEFDAAVVDFLAQHLGAAHPDAAQLGAGR